MAIQVRTTHNVVIDYEVASVARRILSYILDWICIILWYLVWSLYFYSSKDNSFSNILDILDDWSFLPILIFVIVPILFYDLLFECFNKGQSIGKMICQIRVVNIDGTLPDTSGYMIRWLFRLVDFSLTNGVLAVVMVSLSKKSQRLGDYLANTTVIDLKLNRTNKEVNIADVLFQANYNVIYTDVLVKLNDKDIQTILSILNDTTVYTNEVVKNKLVEKTKQITGYNLQANQSNDMFLRKIVNDYYYLSGMDINA